MARYRDLISQAQAARFSHRMRVAVAAACAERAFPILAQQHGMLAGAGQLVGNDVAASALEVPWIVALGGAVSRDEAKWLEHQLSETFVDIVHDLHGCERGAVHALLDAVGAIVEEHAAAAEGVVRGLIDVVDFFADDVKTTEYAWIGAALELAARTSDDAITRTMFDAPDGLPPRWLVHLLEGGEPGDPVEQDLALAATDWAARLATATQARIRVVRDRRSGAVIPTWREPSGIPESYITREVGRGPSSQQGIISTSGHHHHGLFDARSGALLFAPPSAVAFGMAPDLETAFAWRVEKRPHQSGIGRGDYDWILERYRWPETSLLGRHTITSRAVIEWHWPGQLDVPLEGEGRVIVLRAHSEDDSVRLHVVTMRDGSVRETLTRDEAFAWLASGD